MRGSIAAITAVAAIILLVFTINSSIMEQNNNSTFAKMQVGRESAIKAEQAIRILDKATTKVLNATRVGCLNGLNSINVKAEFDSALNDFNKLSPAQCSFMLSQVGNGNPATVAGTLTCFTKINGANSTATKTFGYSKLLWVDFGANCDINDSVSNCMEYQNGTRTTVCKA